MERVTFFLKVNWIKTLYFNFKMLPFSTAVKLPVYFYGKVKFNDLSGKIILEGDIRKGMIGFGQPYEVFTQSKGTAQLFLAGSMVFKGFAQFGKDYVVHVSEGALLTLGNMASLGTNGKILCYEKITLGDYARIGYESQLSDTTAHQMINTLNGEKYPLTSQITVGNYNYISNRVTLLPKTVTPDYCTVASNSVCSKDYSALGNNIMIGGMPAQLLKNNVSRDWEGEKEQLMKWLTV